MHDQSLLYFLFSEHIVEVKYSSQHTYKISVNGGQELVVSGSLVKVDGTLQLSCCLNGHLNKSFVVCCGKDIFLFTEVNYLAKIILSLNRIFSFWLFKLYIFQQAGKFQFSVPTPKFVSVLSKGKGVTEGAAVSPMPGVVDKVFVKVGDTISVGDPLVVIIAMKMEVSFLICVLIHSSLSCWLLSKYFILQYVIKAPKNGRIEKILHNQGENVRKNALLIQFEGDS